MSELPEKWQIEEGKEAPVNMAYWEAGLGPLTEDMIEGLGLEEIEAPDGPYDPMAVYREKATGKTWEIIYDQQDDSCRWYLSDT